MMTLDELPIGRIATIAHVGGEGSLRNHFLSMGLIPQTCVSVVKHAPMGDPVEVCVRGYELTLRLDDARKIEVVEGPPPATSASARSGLSCSSCASCACCAAALIGGGDATCGGAAAAGTAARRLPASDTPHPGLGEGGKFHDRAAEHPLAEDEPIVLALVGNQNSGKTTLFNQVTGLNQHVGNFPGVTVGKESGAVLGRRNTSAVDLPGIYSMSPYTGEEALTRQFLLDERPQGIVNIVDATNIERNLYLTMQLLELGIPMVLALNMMDEVEGNGGTVLVNEMEKLLGIPVVPVSAVKGQGIDELMDHALHVARFQEPPKPQDFCASDENGGAVHRCLHAIMSLVEDHADRADIPLRFAASKLAEGDRLVLEALELDGNEAEALEHIVSQMEAERGLDRAAAIADMRFSFIGRVCAATVRKPRESRERTRSAAVDRVLTGTWTAIPAFALIMATVFWLTFDVIGSRLQELLAAGIEALAGLAEQALTAAQANEVVRSLVLDGVFGGVGTVVSFLPIIAVLFFFLSLLEDSGYMARVAFVMDKLLRKIGLSGRSIVPMLIGFGCTVPAVMATRTLPSERDRKMTVLLTPYMSCSAKLPVYAFFTAAFFPESAGAVMVALYFGGMLVGVLVALVLRRTLFSGEAVPFVMELPNYRMPSARCVGLLVWDKARDFLERAVTVILVATLVIWFLQTFDFGMNAVSNSADSMLAVIAGWMSPALAPLGFGDWRISTALITGFIAKESVVATLSVLFGTTAALTALLTPAAAAALLAFCLLYTPCVAAIAAVNRELGWKWAGTMVVWQISVAWLAAFAVFAIAGLAGL